MEPYPGAQLGAYRIERKVGEGAFGAVWCGSHVDTGERVALKVLLPSVAANAEQVSRFHREAKLLASVRSPNVARMVDFIVDTGFGVVLVMELIDGELFSDLLSAGLVSTEETIDIGTQILDGVCDLHAAGIVHRDLKPNNIMLCTKSDGTRRVVIFDLGLSRFVRDATSSESSRSLTGSHVALGTLECMAPEQILNARDVTERSDIYSVGSILYRAITGSYPFASDDERDLARRKLTVETPEIVSPTGDVIAVGLRAIVTKAARRRPAQRYETAARMRDDLRLLQAAAKEKEKVAKAERAKAADGAYRAKLPTLEIDGRAERAKESKLPVIVGVAVLTAVIGAFFAWHSLVH